MREVMDLSKNMHPNQEAQRKLITKRHD
jgi:hypothetical protein